MAIGALDKPTTYIPYGVWSMEYQVWKGELGFGSP